MAVLVLVVLAVLAVLVAFTCHAARTKDANTPRPSKRNVNRPCLPEVSKTLGCFCAVATMLCRALLWNVLSRLACLTPTKHQLDDLSFMPVNHVHLRCLNMCPACVDVMAAGFSGQQ